MKHPRSLVEPQAVRRWRLGLEPDRQAQGGRRVAQALTAILLGVVGAGVLVLRAMHRPSRAMAVTELLLEGALLVAYRCAYPRELAPFTGRTHLAISTIALVLFAVAVPQAGRAAVGYTAVPLLWVAGWGLLERRKRRPHGSSAED
jgi:hypothetical protein